ncbi:MAG: transglycosylase domain-containing protein [Fastidiosipilaceae bacterium]|jgi:penicillin-binding protein 1A
MSTTPAEERQDAANRYETDRYTPNAAGNPEPPVLDRAQVAELRKTLHKYVKGKPTVQSNRVPIHKMIAHGFGQLIKIICIILALIIFFTGGMGVGTLFGYIATTEPVSAEALKAGSLTSYVYDIEGNQIAKFTGADNVDRVYVPYDSVKDTYIDDAFISIEDERFDTNIGIDPKRIISAIASALVNSGEATHGGSTITQQTVKLITGDTQRSAQRKVQEWYKAIILNQQLTKWEIMELYLNLVPMSNSYVGIQSAAMAYFGKDAADLNLAECAYLAGIPKSPSTYNPLTESGRRNGLRRQRNVLAKMLELGRITEEEYTDALNEDLIFNQQATPSSATNINSYFAEYAVRTAIKDLQDQKGYSASMARTIINSGGVSIYTTMEPDVQEKLDETFQKRDLFAADYSRVENMLEFPQAGMAVINNQTGAIAGLQGGYGKKEANLVLNRATDIQRQPGSVTKPINIYAPAMELYKVTGATVLTDEKVFLDPNNPDEPYPKNAYYPEYRGDMIMRNAVKISNNVPAAKALLMIGVDMSKYYMNEVGINRINDGATIAISTGSYGTGMSPLEIASAFSVFPNNGQYCKHYPYTKVVDSEGNVLLENKPEFKTVYRPSVAYMMTRILEEVVSGRTSNFPYSGSASDYGMLTNNKGETIWMAGKTGTSTDDVDKWFAAFTPYYSAAVWYGYDNRIKKQSVIGPDDPAAKRIMYDAMIPIHENLAGAEWTKPGNIVELSICIRSGKLGTHSCGGGNVITEYFEEDSPLTPTSACPIHGGYPLTPYGDYSYQYVQPTEADPTFLLDPTTATTTTQTLIPEDPLDSMHIPNEATFDDETPIDPEMYPQLPSMH